MEVEVAVVKESFEGKLPRLEAEKESASLPRPLPKLKKCEAPQSTQ
jgi:hypothetical protein